jgi:hypothetical protein
MAKVIDNQDLVLFKNKTRLADDLLREALELASEITGIDGSKVPVLFTSRTVRENHHSGVAVQDYNTEYTNGLRWVTTMGWVKNSDYPIKNSLKITLPKVWGKKDKKSTHTFYQDNIDYASSRGIEVCQSIVWALLESDGQEVDNYGHDCIYSVAAAAKVEAAFAQHRSEYYGKSVEAVQQLWENQVAEEAVAVAV